jgi:uncharacterized protein
VRVVLDTNVLLAAFAARGLCESLVLACLRSHTVVLSEHILGELTEHLRGKLRMSVADAAAIATLLREYSELVEPAPMPPGTCSDPDDVPVLGTAVAGRAEALVTGDRDLLKLGKIEGVPILSPRELYDRLQ